MQQQQTWVEVQAASYPLGTPAKSGDVGYDLHVQIRDQTWLDRVVSWLISRPVHVVWPLVGVRTIHSGVRINMGDTLWCEIRPRSSTSRKKLHVLGGTIDSGYQGELYTVLHNLGLLPRLIGEGERYAQVVFHQAWRPMLEYSRKGFVASERSDSGFGSTGA